MKLRIRRNPFGNKLGWLCSDGLYAYWGETPEEAYKAYDSNLNVPKNRLDARNRLIYRMIKEQIKTIFSIPEDKFKEEEFSPEEIANRFATSCLNHDGNITFADEIET